MQLGAESKQDPTNTITTPKNELLSKSEAEWLEMTEEVFQQLAKESPLLRPGLENMKRNIRFIERNDETPAQ
jgi:epoxyqueuosine reductase QueG